MIINETRGTTLADKASLADTWWARFLGLMGEDNLGIGEGLVLEPCNSVHTCFMKFAIDVVMLNKDNVVVGIYEYLKPYKFTGIHRDAIRVVEVPAGIVTKTRTSFGDSIKFVA